MASGYDPRSTRMYLDLQRLGVALARTPGGVPALMIGSSAALIAGALEQRPDRMTTTALGVGCVAAGFAFLAMR